MTDLASRLPESPLVRAALHALGEGVALTDHTGHIIYTNPAADRIAGVSPPEGAAEGWGEHYGVFMPGSDELFPIEGYPLVRALRGEETDNVEMLIRNASIPEGALIAVTGRPVRDEDGKISGAVVVFRDVTELRQAEMLRRLVPVCSWCRKIRSDDGYWQDLEAYIEASAKARVTHGMCPDCQAEMLDQVI